MLMMMVPPKVRKAVRMITTTAQQYWYGFHRVATPCGASPQAALRLDNAPTLAHPTETRLRVSKLALDSTSARFLREANPEDPSAEIASIVEQRGKMHNPHTSSGGVLLATIEEIGAESPLLDEGRFAVGDHVVPLSSLSCIPLRLTDTLGFHGEVASVDGTAILFGASPVAAIPDDIDPAICLLALDISSLVPQVERAVEPFFFPSKPASLDLDHVGVDLQPPCVYIQGMGKSGLSAMASIRRLEATACPKRKQPIRILASDTDEHAANSEIASKYCDATAVLDSRDAQATMDFLYRENHSLEADLVLATHNQPDCETSAVMACKERGRVIFFSMATIFSQANLATDVAGKDVDCSFGVGIAQDQDVAVFTLLRDDADLRKHFKSLAEDLAKHL